VEYDRTLHINLIKGKLLVFADIEKLPEYREHIYLLHDKHACKSIDMDKLVTQRAADIHPYLFKRIFGQGIIIMIAAFWENIQVALYRVVCAVIHLDSSLAANDIFKAMDIGIMTGDVIIRVGIGYSSHFDVERAVLLRELLSE
jgi:hypothetical protein